MSIIDEIRKQHGLAPLGAGQPSPFSGATPSTGSQGSGKPTPVKRAATGSVGGFTPPAGQPNTGKATPPQPAQTPGSPPRSSWDDRPLDLGRFGNNVVKPPAPKQPEKVELSIDESTLTPGERAALRATVAAEQAGAKFGGKSAVSSPMDNQDLLNSVLDSMMGGSSTPPAPPAPVAQKPAPEQPAASSDASTSTPPAAQTGTQTAPQRQRRTRKKAEAPEAKQAEAQSPVEVTQTPTEQEPAVAEQTSAATVQESAVTAQTPAEAPQATAAQSAAEARSTTQAEQDAILTKKIAEAFRKAKSAPKNKLTQLADKVREAEVFHLTYQGTPLSLRLKLYNAERGDFVYYDFSMDLLRGGKAIFEYYESIKKDIRSIPLVHIPEKNLLVTEDELKSNFVVQELTDGRQARKLFGTLKKIQGLNSKGKGEK